MKPMKLGRKAVISTVIVYLIIVALFNLVIFSIFKPSQFATDNMRLVFWFAYAFVMISAAMQVVSLVMGRFEDGAEAIFFGFNLFSISLFYLGVTFVLSLAFMILVACGVDVPFMVMFVLEVIVLGLYIAAFIISLTHKSVVQQIDQHIKHSVLQIRNLVTDVEVLAESVTDGELKAKLNRLAEDIRYSDPMTSEVVADLDLSIKDLIAELEVHVANGDNASAATTIVKTQLAISKRNKRLADSK
ncbi:MAG: hypothetical protein IKC87_03840 [Clostridia bacterium]|nr:hypothetical protein [Clostridia bacterium]